MEHWITAHLVTFLASAIGASSFLTALVLKFAADKIPGFIAQEEDILIAGFFKKLTLPEDKAALRAVLLAIKVRFPDAGSAIFSVAADSCIREIPALAPYRAQLISLFIEVDKAVVAEIAKGAQS